MLHLRQRMVRRTNRALKFAAIMPIKAFDGHSSDAAVALAKTPPKPGTRFVARQPILTTEEKLFGYELLFRDGTEDYFRASDAEAASRSTLSTSMLIGLDVLCGGHRAFVNCTREVLLKDYVTLLPSPITVVEVLESVEPDDLVVAACQRLKQAGYMIALDDFVLDDPRAALADFADIIKIDIKLTNLDQANEIIHKYGPWRSRMLAEKVETREEFLAAKKAGFLYFQGYFFRRPETLKAHEIPANQLNYLRIWQAIAKPQLNIREIEVVIKCEASLCYRLLRYLNSPVSASAMKLPRSATLCLCSVSGRSAAGSAWWRP